MYSCLIQESNNNYNMATERSIAKDFHDLMKNIKSFSDGQATVNQWDDENLGIFQVTISPKDGPFNEGEFVFEIVSEHDDVPRVYCKTAIYHPNIDTIQDPDGEICLNLFDVDVWTTECSVQDVVQGLLFLIYNPNLQDPLCSVVSSDLSMEEFERNVQKSIAGGRIDDFQFPVNARYARLHPSVKEDGERVEKGDEEGHGRVGKDEIKDGEEKIGADGCKDDMDRRTEGGVHLVPKYFGIKEVCDESSDEEEDDEEEENDSDVEEDDEKAFCDIDDDSEVVNDEDIYDLVDEIADQDALVDDENRKNLDGFVSWSKLVYGTENRTFVDNLQSLMEDQSPGPANSTSNSQGACKEPEPTISRILRKVQRPTVESRFFHALQTRAFRRWLV